MPLLQTTSIMILMPWTTFDLTQTNSTRILNLKENCWEELIKINTKGNGLFWEGKNFTNTRRKMMWSTSQWLVWLGHMSAKLKIKLCPKVLLFMDLNFYSLKAKAAYTTYLSRNKETNGLKFLKTQLVNNL